MEERITELTKHPPRPGLDGFWEIWNPDSGQYEASDIPLPAGGGGGTGNVSSQEVNIIKVLDRAEYDELPQKDPRTLYLIRG